MDRACAYRGAHRCSTALARLPCDTDRSSPLEPQGLLRRTRLRLKTPQPLATTSHRCCTTTLACAALSLCSIPFIPAAIIANDNIDRVKAYSSRPACAGCSAIAPSPVYLVQLLQPVFLTVDRASSCSLRT